MADPVNTAVPEEFTPKQVQALGETVGLLAAMGSTLGQIARNPLTAGYVTQRLVPEVEKLGRAWSDTRSQMDRSNSSFTGLLRAFHDSPRAMGVAIGAFTGFALKLREVQDQAEDLRVAVLRIGTMDNMPGGAGRMIDAFELMQKQAEKQMDYGKQFADQYTKVYTDMFERITRTEEFQEMIRTGNRDAAAAEMKRRADEMATNLTKLSLSFGFDVTPIISDISDKLKGMGVGPEIAARYVKEMYVAIHDGTVPIADSRKAFQDIYGFANQLVAIGFGPKSYSEATRLYKGLVGATGSRETTNQLLNVTGQLSAPGVAGANARTAFFAPLSQLTGISIPGGMQQVVQHGLPGGPEQTASLVARMIRALPGRSNEMLAQPLQVQQLLAQAGVSPQFFNMVRTGRFDQKELQRILTEKPKEEKPGADVFSPQFLDGVQGVNDRFKDLGRWTDTLIGAFNKLIAWIDEKTGGVNLPTILSVLSGGANAYLGYRTLKLGGQLAAAAAGKAAGVAGEVVETNIPRGLVDQFGKPIVSAAGKSLGRSLVGRALGLAGEAVGPATLAFTESGDRAMTFTEKQAGVTQKQDIVRAVLAKQGFVEGTEAFYNKFQEISKELEPRPGFLGFGGGVPTEVLAKYARMANEPAAPSAFGGMGPVANMPPYGQPINFTVSIDNALPGKWSGTVSDVANQSHIRLQSLVKDSTGTHGQ